MKERIKRVAVDVYPEYSSEEERREALNRGALKLALWNEKYLKEHIIKSDGRKAEI